MLSLIDIVYLIVQANPHLLHNNRSVTLVNKYRFVDSFNYICWNISFATGLPDFNSRNCMQRVVFE